MDCEREKIEKDQADLDERKETPLIIETGEREENIINSISSKSSQQESSGEKVKIISYLDETFVYGGFKGDVEQYILKDTENLRIGWMPLHISNIRGLEQLNNVKRLILGAIENISGEPEDVIDSIVIFKGLEELYIDACNLKDMDFINNFKKLKILVMENTEIENNKIDLSELSMLEYFILLEYGNVSMPEKATPLELNLPFNIKEIYIWYTLSPIRLKNIKIEDINKLGKIYLTKIKSERFKKMRTILLDEDGKEIPEGKNIEYIYDDEYDKFLPNGLKRNDISYKFDTYVGIGK